LLEEATAHAAWAKKRSSSCDRLAFVGDSLLSQIVTLHLDREFPQSKVPPGVLSRIRAQVVADDTLRVVAERIGLDAIAVSLAPEDQRAQAAAVVSTGKPLASMFEALIAACWRHHGPELTSAAVIDCLTPEIAAAVDHPVEVKSELQELLAKSSQTVRYEGTSQSGPSHAPIFVVAAIREPDGVTLGSGAGGSKKAAEIAAAQEALERLAAGEA